MRAKHRRILQSMRARPTPAGIRRADIAAMLGAAGVEISERSGPRVLLKKDAERMIVHPAAAGPDGELRHGARLTAFLEAAGVEP